MFTAGFIPKQLDIEQDLILYVKTNIYRGLLDSQILDY